MNIQSLDVLPNDAIKKLHIHTFMRDDEVCEKDGILYIIDSEENIIKIEKKDFLDWIIENYPVDIKSKGLRVLG